MSTPRLAVPAFLLLVAALPAAAGSTPPACDADDVDLDYFFAHVDASFDVGDNLSGARPGDLVLVGATLGADCEGALLTVTTYTRPDLAVFDQFPDAEFFAIVAVPDCAFRIEVALGDVVLEQVDGGEGSCVFGPLPCPGDVTATATEDGVEVAWSEVEETNETGAILAYGVWRAEGDAAFDEDPYAVLPPGTTAFLDEDVEAGATYRYFVKVGGPRGESEDCPIVEATAVPFFGAPVVGALAAVGAVGAYVMLRRRA